jgi:methionyl-tRNA formyltransferase
MRVVLFGSGSPIAVAALEALDGVATVVAVVVPAGPRIRGPRSALRALAGRRARAGLVRAARRRRVPVLRARRGPDPDLDAALRRLEPDLICVATFPTLVPASLLAVPRLGALGLHPSLLPRHRGPAPHFWTYFHDDPEAGVTVFWMDAGEDTGDLAFQERIPLARGRAGGDLHAEVARRGSALLARTVAAAAAGQAPRSPQDHARATREPSPAAGTWGIDFASWGAERVWHFLRGVGALAVLVDARGRPVPHGPARGYRLEPAAGTLGVMERAGSGWRLRCRDGVVELDGLSPATRVLWLARRLASGWRWPGSSPRREAGGERTGTRSSA